MATHTILVADDEPNIRRSLREILEFEDYAVVEAADGDEALARAQAGGLDLVLLDIKMPRRDGMEVLKALHDAEVGVPVIMISGHGTVDTAVEATQLGAVDFLEKPPDLNRLLVSVRGALSRGKLQTENKRLRETVRDTERAELTPIVGTSPAIGRIQATIGRVAPTEARVLITGEPGTGKELVARWVHARSARADGPLVEVNCAAIPSELIESELFGHEKGAFTGATRQRVGKFEQADGGTLFLDEVGELDLGLQAKLLRALQTREVTRVGGTGVIRFDCRVISATNRDILDMVSRGTFREDLYYRLFQFPITLPPLRARGDDVLVLAQDFLTAYVEKHPRFKGKRLGAEAVRALLDYPWPGNVRELKSTVERAVLIADADEIVAADLMLGGTHQAIRPWAERTASPSGDGARFAVPEPQVGSRPPEPEPVLPVEEPEPAPGEWPPLAVAAPAAPPPAPATVPLDDLKRRAVEDAYARCDRNAERAAAELGIGRATMYRLLKKYDLA